MISPLIRWDGYTPNPVRVSVSDLMSVFFELIGNAPGDQPPCQEPCTSTKNFVSI